MIVLGRKPGGTGGGGGGPPSGPAGGDLTGTYPNPSIANGVVTDAMMDSGTAGSGDVLTADGAGGAAYLSVGGGLFDALALLQYRQSSGTGGGTATSGSFLAVPLSNEILDTANIVGGTLPSFSLPAASYYVEAFQMFYDVGRAQLKIRDTTNSADLALGASIFTTDSGNDGSIAVLSGAFTLAGAATLQLQYRVENTENTQGLGIDAGFGVANVFSSVTIWRFA